MFASRLYSHFNAGLGGNQKEKAGDAKVSRPPALGNGSAYRKALANPQTANISAPPPVCFTFSRRVDYMPAGSSRQNFYIRAVPLCTSEDK